MSQLVPSTPLNTASSDRFGRRSRCAAWTIMAQQDCVDRHVDVHLSRPWRFDRIVRNCAWVRIQRHTACIRRWGGQNPLSLARLRGRQIAEEEMSSYSCGPLEVQDTSIEADEEEATHSHTNAPPTCCTSSARMLVKVLPDLSSLTCTWPIPALVARRKCALTWMGST